MLTAPARRAIINSMSPLSVPVGTEIITQGDADATRFFVLASGRATVHVADSRTGTRKQVATIKPARRASAAPAHQDCGYGSAIVQDRGHYSLLCRSSTCLLGIGVPSSTCHNIGLPK